MPAEAFARGGNWVGPLGSDNYFLEVQRVTDVYDKATAGAYDIAEGDVTVMIHLGSRGVGHRTYSEYVRRFEKAPEVVAALDNRQLVYAPLVNDFIEKNRRAMYATANFVWANRQAMTHAVRKAFDTLF